MALRPGAPRHLPLVPEAGRPARSTLRQIHCLLHRAGYAVAHYHPVKALADALGHEADAGRAQQGPPSDLRPPPGDPADGDLEPALPDR